MIGRNASGWKSMTKVFGFRVYSKLKFCTTLHLGRHFLHTWEGSDAASLCSTHWKVVCERMPHQCRWVGPSWSWQDPNTLILSEISWLQNLGRILRKIIYHFPVITFNCAGKSTSLVEITLPNLDIFLQLLIDRSCRPYKVSPRAQYTVQFQQ